MKDPSSSAYTFAYFVDVAGREIDMARRHNRRFALATIGVQFEAVPLADVERRSWSPITCSPRARHRRARSCRRQRVLLAVAGDWWARRTYLPSSCAR